MELFLYPCSQRQFNGKANKWLLYKDAEDCHECEWKRSYHNMDFFHLKIQQKRMRMACLCIKHKEEIVSKLVLKEALDSKRKRVRSPANVIY